MITCRNGPYFIHVLLFFFACVCVFCSKESHARMLPITVDSLINADSL